MLSRVRGFSLVEILVVLSILGLVFVGVLNTFGTFHRSGNLELSKKNTANIKEQIMQFALVYKHLPCPDTDNDGSENRSTDGTCSQNPIGNEQYGGVPYLDIGLQQSDVLDPWGNPLRYAVNRDTDNAVDICNNNSAASYFCNQAAGNTAWFTFETPPTTSDATNTAQFGSGNYTICNSTTAQCDGASTASQRVTNNAIALLVAYNEDGAQALASAASCAATAGAINNNCNTDEFYHQAAQSNEDAQYFDDVIIPFTATELKARVLDLSLVWTRFTGTARTVTPTFSEFDMNGQDSQGYSANDDANNPDIVLVNREVSTAMDYGAGDDYLAIGGGVAANSNIEMGEGNDTLFIGNDTPDIANYLFSYVDLGPGDDVFALQADLTNGLTAGDGNDWVWVQGNVNSQQSANLSLDDGDDVLWLGKADSLYPSSGKINGLIDGGSGYNILVLEAMTKTQWLENNDIQNNVVDFNMVVFKDDGNGNRESLVLTP